MHLENEIRILEVDVDKLKDKLLNNGFEYISTNFQKRYVYDFNPISPNKWIRLRTNGEKSTLTIKEIVDYSAVDGTKEWEIEVSDFNETNEILNQLGYYARNYQENKRIIFRKTGVEIVIDTWPLIPTYCEIEAESTEIIKQTLTELNIKEEDTTTLDVNSIYKKYGIDIKSIKYLKFEE